MNYLGIDYGKKRVGIAYSEGIQAQALLELATAEALSRIIELVSERKIDHCIIGLPEGPLAASVKKFAEILDHNIRIPLTFWDETLTSDTAKKLLLISGKSKKRQKQTEHQLAAAIILQDFLDQRDTV